MSANQKLIAIVGPTASGKSDLAVFLAGQFNGEVISADSRQVYKWMNIGTGKITPEEMQGVPHYLLDVADPNKAFTVTQFKNLAEEALADIRKRDKLPIIAGGTGMYVQALVDGSVFPEVPPNDALRNTLRKASTEELFTQLQEKDPDRAATIDPHNKRRLIRALEIIEATGQPVPSLSEQAQRNSDILLLGINPPREILNEKIAKRFNSWMAEGFLEEVRALHDEHNVSWERFGELGQDYKWAARYLSGEATEAQMRKRSIKEIQQYAKRQMTWFRRDERIHWFSSLKEAKAQSPRLVQTLLAAK